MILLISYDLKVPGRNYDSLYQAIKSAGYWWHYLESTWIIKTDETIDIWKNRLMEHLDGNDRLILVDISEQSRDGWLPQKAWDWLQKRDT